MLVFTESNESVDLNRCIGTRCGEYTVNKYHTHLCLFYDVHDLFHFVRIENFQFVGFGSETYWAREQKKIVS